MQCLSETLDELVFTDNGDAQLLGFLVLARLRGYIVVDEVVGRAAYATCNLAALTLDIGLELVAVFVVVHIAGHYECHSLATGTGGRGCLCLDFYLGEQTGHHPAVRGIVEPLHYSSRFLGAYAVDVGKVFRVVGLRGLGYQLFEGVCGEQTLAHVGAA